jgi:TolB-like protein
VSQNEAGESRRESRRGFGGFLAELKRRHVVRAGVAYAAVGFVVLQAAEIIQQAWTFPDWALRLVVVFTLLGFPLVLALAWVFEITPLGLRTTSEVDAGAGVGALEAGGLPRVAFLAVTVVVVGASGWWWVRSTVGEEAVGRGSAASAFPVAVAREPGEPIRSLAVLPFESFSEERGSDYFAQGMHEALISQLGQLDFLRVLSRTSSVEYDTRGKSMPQIGAELGVDAVVEGSVLRAEGRVRITVQLIEVATDRHLWARDYERDLVDIIALQREVAEAIVRELRGELEPAQLTPGDRVADARLPTTDPEATDAVMLGRMALAGLPGDGAPSASALDSAGAYFERAIRRDSGFAAAHRGLAQVQLMRVLAAGGLPTAEGIRAAVESARQALALDPGSRETQEVMAHLALLGRVPDEERPMFAVTEAGRQLQIAFARREEDSDSPAARMRAARRYVATGRPAQAQAILERLIETDPGNLPAWDELEQIHRVVGDLDAVVSLWRARTREAPGPEPGARSVDALGRAVAREGLRGYWSWRLAELETRSARGAPVSLVELAAAYAGVGRGDRALELLAEGAEAGDPRLRSIRGDPVWDPFRRDVRFTAILAQADPLGGPPTPGRSERERPDDGRPGGGS